MPKVSTLAMPLLYRLRAWGTSFLREFLVVLRDGAWSLPDAVPDRYLARVDKTLTLALADGSTVDAWLVERSSSHASPPMRTLADLRDHGLWIVPDDLTPRGAFPGDIKALPVPARVTVFGAAVAAGVEQAIAQVQARMPGGVSVLALYHGTSAEAGVAIRREARLKASFGMSGTAVYLGTWPKACRYAGRDAECIPRATGGVIFRCLLEPGRVVEHTADRRPCTCDDCAARVKHSAAQRAYAAVSDHKVTWAATADTVYVGPVQATETQWVTRNAEWAVTQERADTALQICECVALDMTSLAGPDYDPYQRSQRFL